MQIWTDHVSFRGMESGENQSMIYQKCNVTQWCIEIYSFLVIVKAQMGDFAPWEK